MISDAWRAGLDGRLARQLGFLLQADRLKSVIRGSRIADGSRRENTAEHSWHLALFALVLREWAVGEVDAWRVVRMLVLHDLVEIECGDTPLFDAAGAATQAERERLAADVVFGLLPPDQAQERRRCCGTAGTCAAWCATRRKRGGSVRTGSNGWPATRWPRPTLPPPRKAWTWCSTGPTRRATATGAASRSPCSATWSPRPRPPARG